MPVPVPVPGLGPEPEPVPVPVPVPVPAQAQVAAGLPGSELFGALAPEPASVEAGEASALPRS
eukprot:COSAG04_NODE_2142_length_4706_cov_2.206859_4_plen_63_part_00